VWVRRFGVRWGVYARHRLDLSLGDIFFGLGSCFLPWRRGRLESEVLGLCSTNDNGLVCHSVRSGWDLWLGAQDFRAGDEILVSAVTHPDMVRIIRGHGLRAVPVDIDPRTLAPLPSVLEAALTPRTRVVLVAHLFGGRMDLDIVAGFARKHGLILVEDCAQAFQGPEQVGDTAADVSMYSFGTLKTSTALGGAVLRMRDHAVLREMRHTPAHYPVQRRASYMKKLLISLGIVTVTRPRPYGLLARFCTWLGADLDAIVNRAVRAFPSGEPERMFYRRLRQRPCKPLLAVLARRLRSFDQVRLALRSAAGERFAHKLRIADAHPGGHSLRRTHWLFPVVVQDPGSLILELRTRGLDASRATSSITFVDAPDEHSQPVHARRMMSGVVFLPVYPELSPRALDAMVNVLSDCAASEAVEVATLS
jgi:perosamine synthetase